MKNSIPKQKMWKNIFLSTSIFFLVLSLVLGTLVYLNWDYISFKYFMSSQYLKTDLLDSIYEDQVGIDPHGEYYKYFDNLSIAAVTKLIRDTGLDHYTYQYNPSQFTDYTSGREEKAALSHTKELTPNTIYMSLTNFIPNTLSFFKSSIEELNKYDNLVLDLRRNGGGDLDIIFKIADFFIEKDAVMLIEYRRSQTSDIISKNNSVFSFDKIIILHDEYTASASEQLIVILKYGLDIITTVGKSTYGKSVGQTRIPLLRGFYVKATTLEWRSPDGTVIKETGIIPDFFYMEEDIIDYILNEILE